jgi:sugar lactone lactonase YvrE
MDGKDRILMVDFLTGILYRIVLKTGAMEVVAQGFGGGDGVTRGHNGLLYISDWATGRVFSLSKNGEVKLIASDFKSAADIGMAPDGKHLLVPDMKAGELVYLPIGQ